MAMLSSSLTQVLLDYSQNEKPSLDYAKRYASSESSTSEQHLMVTYDDHEAFVQSIAVAKKVDLSV